MKPLDNLERYIQKMTQQGAANILSDYEKKDWDSYTNADKERHLKDLIEKPLEFDNPMSMWYFKTKWGEALRAVLSDAPVNVLEIASGANDLVPQVVAKLYGHSDTTYTTVNLNKGLTAEFKRRTEGLPIQVNVIEDAAQKLESYFGSEKADVVVFEHSFNDIIEAMLVERDGVDTINTDWMEILPLMVEKVNRAYLDKTLESAIKDEFLKILESCLDVLKPNSFIVVSQFQFQYSLDVGMNPELLENYLPIVRGWIANAGIGEEVFIEGFEPQWWMFLKKR